MRAPSVGILCVPLLSYLLGRNATRVLRPPPRDVRAVERLAAHNTSIAFMSRMAEVGHTNYDAPVAIAQPNSGRFLEMSSGSSSLLSLSYMFLAVDEEMASRKGSGL
jgi:hypothetical protein